MASLSTAANGTRMIQFSDATGKRRTIRLGPMPKKAAESIKLRVEAFLALSSAKMPMDAELATWVGTIGDDLAAKLAGVGLIPARDSQALGPFLDSYLSARRADAKGSRFFACVPR